MSQEERGAARARQLQQQREYRTANAAAVKSRKAAYYQRNKARNKAKGDAWRKKNPDRLRQLARGWLSRRRDLTRGGLTAAQTANWAQSQKKVCHWCGRPCTKSYHIDHILALSKGGRHEICNLAIACPPCNLSKGNKDAIEFAQSIGKLL